MDIDRYIASHEPAWQRLEALTRRAERSVRGLQRPDLDELVDLHQRVSSNLSTVRASYDDPALSSHLSRLVARAGAVVHGTRGRSWADLGRALTWTFPAAVWHVRRPIAVSAGLFLAAAVAVGLWITGSPAAYEASMPPEVREAYLQRDFEAYYSSQPAAQFASYVFTNNVRVAILAFAAGIVLCVPTALVLGLNGAHLGVAAGLFTASGLAGRFWGLIVPHGLLELTAVFIAGGAGLRLGWTVIDPGDRPRTDALATEGRRTVVIVLGLVLVFLVAGLIEAFVTPSGLPTWSRVGVGVLVEIAFVAFVVVQGRLAADRGLTGALGETPPR